MIVTNISHAKAHLSALLKRVKQGETVLIKDRDVPIARIEPAAQTQLTDRLAKLERAGQLRGGDGKLVKELVNGRRPRVRGMDPVKLLIAERRKR